MLAGKQKGFGFQAKSQEVFVQVKQTSFVQLDQLFPYDGSTRRSFESKPMPPYFLGTFCLFRIGF
jgi:hypothetical protein